MTQHNKVSPIHHGISWLAFSSGVHFGKIMEEIQTYAKTAWKIAQSCNACKNETNMIHQLWTRMQNLHESLQ